MKRKLILTAIIFAVVCVSIIALAPAADFQIAEDYKAEGTVCEKHIYANNGEYTVINEATCSAKGVKYRSCLVCGKKDIVETAKNPDNHSSVSSIITYEVKPTCTDGGIGHYVCRGCNKSAKTVELAPDPEAHAKNGDFIVIYPATCKAAGTMAHQCKYCNAYFNQQSVPADPEAHITSENSSWLVTKLPTCAEKGEMVCYCDLCSAIAITKEIAATNNHTPVSEWTVIKDSNCTEDGEKAQLCSVCNQPQNITAVPKEADKHTFSDEFTVDAAPTCTQIGEKSRHCLYCDARKDITEMPIDSTFHDYSDEWIVTKEPTCSESGYKHKLCTRCGVASVSTVIEKPPHTYPEEYELLQNSADGLSAKVKYVCTVCGYEYITIVNFGGTGGDGNIGDDIDPITKIKKILPTDTTVIKVDYENLIVSNVIRKMYIADFLAKFKNSSVFVVYNEKNEFANENGYIGTGYRLNHETPDGVVTNYYVSVTGDLDSDGMITAADARLALRASAKIDNLTSAYFIAADTNSDGKITAMDARTILLVAAGLKFFDETYEMPK